MPTIRPTKVSSSNRRHAPCLPSRSIRDDWNPKPPWISPARYKSLVNPSPLSLSALGEYLLPSSTQPSTSSPLSSVQVSTLMPNYLTFTKPSLIGPQHSDSYLHLECGKESALGRRILRTNRKTGCNVLIPVDPSRPGRRPKSPPPHTVCECGNAARYIFTLASGFRFYVCASHFAYWEQRRKRLIPRRKRRYTRIKS